MEKLLLTKELGRLVRWLRILGFDAVYFKQDNPGALIIEALKEDRVIITRNHRFAQPRGLRIVLIKEEKIKAQLAETLKALRIRPSPDVMFTRCILCNEELIKLEKDKAKERVPEYVFSTQGSFTSCPQCMRVYWPGTHWGKVEEVIKEIGY